MSALLIGLVLNMIWAPVTQAGTTINVAAGNVAALIAAINSANSESGPFVGQDTINLAGGTYTLTQAIVQPESSGPNGLPLISSQIVINGNGSIIERALGGGTPDNPCGGTGAKFRLLRVVKTGIPEARLTLRNVTLRYGCAQVTPPGSGRDGGAILNGGGPNHAGITTLENVTLTNNMASNNGGAIRNANGTLSATNCIIRNNRAINHGGGIANVAQDPNFPSGPISLNRCTVAQNVAGSSGGGIMNNDINNTLLVTNSTVTQNSAPLGGGIRNSGAEFMILDTTFDRNTASDAGGAIHNNSALDNMLVNVTLAGNTATNAGGGILNRTASNISLLNTLLANGNRNCGGTAITSLGHNLATDMTCALTGPGDRPGTNPQLGAYTDNGTPGNGHYPLSAASLAINGGDQDECEAIPELATDQIGQPRADAVCDIGAIEGQGGAGPGTGAPFAVFRPGQGRWFFDTNHDGTTDLAVTYGTNGDIPVPGDYDGNETMDLAVFRPSTGTWFVDTDRNGTTDLSRRYGTNGDIPVPGDYNGDGITDFAVFRPSTGTWFVDTDRNGTTDLSRRYGTNGDIPLVGDFDGDGEADFAVFRPSQGRWFVDFDKNGGTDLNRAYGMNGDIPVPADYNNDLETDLAVFRPSQGRWFVDTNQDGTTNLSQRYGMNGDMPLWPNGWIFQALEIFP